ncbi:LRR receptor-like serine/threonine-protein kinase EFR [Cryptomeria japonica]|uniref:LRR receptor-like serine/threonine-protein kinase EFR n=1 Tax=Cryptomeria japonica TaxID=3369 RepID=UPI0027DA8040|nr:LRR receptor-like serine/threonine-protein kinase EFR [Cryptomeria japonica]
MDNHLSGNIPQQLDFLPELIVSGFNNLTGTIPNSLGNIFSLDQLDLGNNQFREISFLALNVNHLTGQNPSSSNCTVLEVLDINDNNITGEITGELFSKTTNLMELYLAINQLTGSLPVSLFTCSQLEQLEVSGNRLSGTVPTELGKLYRLIWLNLGSNQFTSGSKSTLSILTALANCSLLEVILLSGNHPTGVITLFCGTTFYKVRELGLDRNKIIGEISPHVGNLTNLTELYLNLNLLTGAIPSSFRV